VPVNVPVNVATLQANAVLPESSVLAPPVPLNDPPVLFHIEAPADDAIVANIATSIAPSSRARMDVRFMVCS
jgi:hypothetical protein